MKTTYYGVAVGLPLCVVSLMLLGGCGDDEGGPTEICTWIKDPSECPNVSDGSNDEVGDGDGDANEDSDGDGDTGDGDGDGDDDYEGSATCSMQTSDIPRTVFQCNGSLTVSVAFETYFGDCANTLGDPGWCDESHDFGTGIEDYEMPAVMACCDAEGVAEDVILTYCAADMIEQICRSLPARLDSLLDQGAIKLGKNQAKGLRNWLNDHQQACYDALNRHSDVPGELKPTSWLVNNGKNKAWSLLENFTVRLEEGAVTSVTLPAEDGEQARCYDNKFNNSEIFEETGPISAGVTDIYHLAEAPDVSIAGPTFAGGRVFGTAALGSRSRQCNTPWCSSVAISEVDHDFWMLEDLSLFADGPVEVQYGDVSVELDRAALRLYGVSHGEVRSGLYIIAPGDAQFTISGALSGQPADVRGARNDTRITARKSGNGWTIDSFTAVHVDGEGEVWKVTVPATTWD